MWLFVEFYLSVFAMVGVMALVWRIGIDKVKELYLGDNAA
jgi:hypothetical protein